jgi:hypothetical protein
MNLNRTNVPKQHYYSPESNVKLCWFLINVGRLLFISVSRLHMQMNLFPFVQIFDVDLDLKGDAYSYHSLVLRELVYYYVNNTG